VQASPQRFPCHPIHIIHYSNMILSRLAVYSLTIILTKVNLHSVASQNSFSTVGVIVYSILPFYHFVNLKSHL
jgi:hypothetical protein